MDCDNDGTGAWAGVPSPLVLWAQGRGLDAYEWRRAELAAYDQTADAWHVGEVSLPFAVEDVFGRYYCGVYTGPLEPVPVVYWVVLYKALTPPPEVRAKQTEEIPYDKLPLWNTGAEE